MPENFFCVLSLFKSEKLNTNQWLRMNSRKITCTDQNYTFLHVTFKTGEKR